MNESCPGLVAQDRPRGVPAALRLAALKDGEVRINYIGHSTFLIESPKLVRIATDYNDYVKPPVLPDIATMNHAHSTHYTDRPEPGIKHVLRGWREDGKPTDWDLQYQDVRVRSVATNIRDYYGGGGTRRHGNSIFIYEVGNLCIAHLGHLHHTLNQQQLNEIGRVDVVLVPVDAAPPSTSTAWSSAGRPEGAADDPDALFLDLHAGALHGAHQQGLGRRTSRSPVGRHFEAHLAGKTEAPGPAGPFVLITICISRSRRRGRVRARSALTLARILTIGSGDTPREHKMSMYVDRTKGFLGAARQDVPLPAWLSEADIDVFAAEYQRTGFRGGLNWYRNIDRNWELTAPWAGARIMQPALFIAGTRDAVITGSIDNARSTKWKMSWPNLERKIMIEGAGHWIQQERPAEVNAALIEFARPASCTVMIPLVLVPDQVGDKLARTQSRKIKLDSRLRGNERMIGQT